MDKKQTDTEVLEFLGEGEAGDIDVNEGLDPTPAYILMRKYAEDGADG